MRPPLVAPGVGERRWWSAFSLALSPPGILRRYGEGDLRAWAFRREEWSHGPVAAGCGGGGGGLLGGLGRPQLVATPNHVQRRVERLRVDHGADVARQFADEEGDLRLVQGRRLQGGQIVPKHRGPGVTAAHRVVQPLVGSLLVSHAIGFQEELLHLLVRVGDGGGVARQRADGGGQREGKFGHGPVEFRFRQGDVCCGKLGIQIVEPTLRRIGVKIG